MKPLFLTSFIVILFFFIPMVVNSQVLSHQKISNTQGGFTGTLDHEDWFGTHMASIGDLDGDGFMDMAVGAMGDDDGGKDRGAVWILFLNPDGTVKSHQKISDTQGGFMGLLYNEDRFGVAVDSLGDLDGDSVVDLAVGAYWSDDGGSKSGAVWILFLNSDGTVKSHQKISSTDGNFTGIIGGSKFGSSLTSLGDLDGDLVTDLAVGAIYDGDGVAYAGAVWILFLNRNGTVKSHQKISATHGGFTGILDYKDQFGFRLETIQDLDKDGVNDLATSCPSDDDGGDGRGAVWLLFLKPDGTVKSHQKISDTEGGFTGILDDKDAFGSGLAWLGDLNGDGVGDLGVGARGDDDGGIDRGAMWLLFLNPDGTVKSHKKISSTQGNFKGNLDDGDWFGHPANAIEDLDGNGLNELVVDAMFDDDGNLDSGAVWVLFLENVSVLMADADTLSASTGGTVNFTLDADATNANRNYLLLGSITGTEPGLPLPGGKVTLPLNWDLLTNKIINLLNTSIFFDFMGTLDGNGTASAQLNIGPIPSAAGITMHFAYALNGPWDTVSNYVAVSIVP